MQVIRGLVYRHIAGYLKIVGRTKNSAERHTKSVGTLLRTQLPQGTVIKPGRYRGLREGLHVYEVPVLLNRPGVRSILSTLALQGGS